MKRMIVPNGNISSVREILTGLLWVVRFTLINPTLIHLQVEKAEKEKYRQELTSYHGRAETFESEKYYKVSNSGLHSLRN